MEFLKATDELDFSFYRIPKNFKDLAKQGISHTAILLYGLLLDRWELSKKNKNDWSNEKGEVFLYFGRDAAAEELAVSEKTITRAFKELAEHGLILEKRQGQGKPNMIFLTKTPVIQQKGTFYGSENKKQGEQNKQPETLGIKGEDPTEEKQDKLKNPLESRTKSRPEESTVLEPKKVPPNDTEFSNTYFNDTEIRVGTAEPTRPLPSPSYELSREIWNYYQSAYRFYSEYRTGKEEKHPHYKPDQLEDCLLTLSAFIADNDLHYDDLIGMVKKYFTSGFKNCDFRFSHFCTEGILKNRMFEHRREPDHY